MKLATYVKGIIWSLAGILGGSAMNLVALFANDGLMPVYLGQYMDEPFVLDSRHACMTVDTNLKAICDIIPIGHGMIASPGDFILLAGVLLLVWIFLHATYEVIKYKWFTR